MQWCVLLQILQTKVASIIYVSSKSNSANAIVAIRTVTDRGNEVVQFLMFITVFLLLTVLLICRLLIGLVYRRSKAFFDFLLIL